VNVLVLGGYGFFGARIARALADHPQIRLWIGGRDRAKAERAARSLGLAESRGVGLDAHDANLAAHLQRLGVNVLIHAAGPFQGQSYEVAEAAISAMCHYIDLADGRAFVTGISELDARARARGISVISGASSLPALSSAVVDRYVSRFSRLTAIRIGIASGARAPGLATVRGVFGYVGRPFSRLERGVWVSAYGWMDLHRHRFPAPLGRRWMGNCDVPDLALFPERYLSASTVTFQAGFASDLGHLCVWALAGLVRAGVFGSAAPFAAPLSRLSRLLEPIVSDKGGMFVTLEGQDPIGGALTLTWNLIAAQNHGPSIPCGAAIALARRWANGEHPPIGAMPCIGLLSVEEYLAPLRDLDIRELPP
jgi:saccharopine dehydrogenase-like NADP-dependent oxidoreductase